MTEGPKQCSKDPLVFVTVVTLPIRHLASRVGSFSRCLPITSVVVLISDFHHVSRWQHAAHRGNFERPKLMKELAYQLSVAGESLGKELASEATFLQGPREFYCLGCSSRVHRGVEALHTATARRCDLPKSLPRSLSAIRRRPTLRPSSSPVRKPAPQLVASEASGIRSRPFLGFSEGGGVRPGFKLSGILQPHLVSSRGVLSLIVVLSSCYCLGEANNAYDGIITAFT